MQDSNFLKTSFGSLVGGVVRGGIEIRADHVTLRDVTVVGGRDGIDIEHADDVVLDHVRVVRTTLTGIRAYDYVQVLSDVEKELKKSGLSNVLLVPALAD